MLVGILCKFTKNIVKCRLIGNTMAKQTSDITLSGKLGDHVHYHRNGKHFTKRASTKPHNFSPRSVAAQETFGLGSAVGKQLKIALKPVLDEYKYDGIHNRLTEVCKQIFRKGPIHPSETKRFEDYNIKMLLGLNLNRHTAIESLIYKNPLELLYSPTGEIKIMVNEHNPTEVFPNHLKMYAASIRFLFLIIDLEKPSHTHHQTQEIIIPLNQSHFAKIQGSVHLGSVDNKLLMCCTQLRYYGNADCHSYSNNKKLVAAAITAIEYIKNGAFVSYPPFNQHEAKPLANKGVPLNTIAIKWE